MNKHLNQNLKSYKWLTRAQGGLEWENTVLLLVCNNVRHELGRNGLFPPGKAVNQGRIAQNVDHPGDATTYGSDFGAGFQGENRPRRRRRTDRIQSKCNII